jgi:hypothetical protein
MQSFALKSVLVLAAALIAAGVTCLPWLVLFKLPDSVSTFWGITAILWAPLALVAGIVGGCFFAYTLWPRNS